MKTIDLAPCCPKGTGGVREGLIVGDVVRLWLGCGGRICGGVYVWRGVVVCTCGGVLWWGVRVEGSCRGGRICGGVFMWRGVVGVCWDDGRCAGVGCAGDGGVLGFVEVESAVLTVGCRGVCWGVVRV